MTYTFLPHTADARLAIDGASLEVVFTDALAAIRELLVGNTPVRPVRSRPIALRADGPAVLLLRWLQELLYRYDTDRFVPAEATFARLTPTSLQATVRGEGFDPARHETQPEIKAVTRHGLRLEQEGQNGIWHAEVLFDL